MRFPPAALMALATLLFALMGVCVKLASAIYGTGEIVFYRGLVGTFSLALLCRARGISWRTAVPGMHFWRGLSGVISLSLWFYAIGGLPLPTAISLIFMCSVWMALFLIGGAVAVGGTRIDGRLVATVLVGFVGVALVLRPTIERDQLWHGLLGLLSGMLAALAYLQVTALGRAGEPEERTVLYFSIGGVVAGALLALASGGFGGHSLKGAALLLGVGVFATAAQLLMTRAYATGRVLVNASLQYLGIVYAFILGALLFDDAVPPLAIAGMLLIIGAGLAATLLRQRSALQRPSDAEHSTVET